MVALHQSREDIDMGSTEIASGTSDDSRSPSQEEEDQWSEDRVEILKKLWAEGLSASQIASELGDVTRNAVIGKVHRLKLPKRARPAGRTSPRRPRTPRTPQATPPPQRSASANRFNPVVFQSGRSARQRPQPVQPQDLSEPIPLNATILTLTKHACRWPIGDPIEGKDDFCFCGHESWEGKPYCEYHSRLAYYPQPRREKTAA